MEDEITKKIIELRNQGMTFSDIAKQLNRSIYFVYSRVNKRYTPKKLVENVQA